MTSISEIKPGQSLDLLKELHILTRDGNLNQDSRRKLKQVYHLYQFIEPLMKKVEEEKGSVTLIDHGAGKSYLGFILYDLFFKSKENGRIIGVETRAELIKKSQELATKLKFPRMTFLNQTVKESNLSQDLPENIDIVTALHACDTATDDAIDFGLEKNTKFMVLVPCCQAEVASEFRKNKNVMMGKTALTQIWRHALHTREFGSHITNVLRCLRLEAHGYQVTVTELIGWEHSMKNELIIAEKTNQPNNQAQKKLKELLNVLGLESLSERFNC